MTTVRTRFAPSPTGELHPGNARIAVLNWLFARHAKGHFVIRIEDTDVDRNLPGSEAEILTTLSRLGLDWDEGPDIGGSYAPYRQSERGAIYREYAQRLLESGAAFRCYCGMEELLAKREAAMLRGQQPVYDGTCRDLDPAQEERYHQQGIPASVRFAASAEPLVVEDLVRGSITFDPAEFGDFVIMKSDGTPTYNFAVVVDDSAMQISHVIRGVGHLTNTRRQAMLYRALEIAPPIFVHVPHVMGPDGAPLSKRHGARSLREYLDLGYHEDALVNYLSLLSWSSPTGDEVLPPARLMQEIDLSRIGASDARLDPEKLEWMSGEYIRAMTVEELAERLVQQLGATAIGKEDDERLRIASAIQERINTFSDASRFLPQFFPPDPMSWDAEAVEVLRGVGLLGTLEAVVTKLKGVEDWDGDTAMVAVRAAGKEIGVKGRDLFMPVRAALTGATQGPELADVFAVQGKATTLRVLEQARNFVKGRPGT